MKTEYKIISNRAKSLLAREEGYDVEFKKSLVDLDSSDIVAFANSEQGGVILIGVDEGKTETGRQRGIVVGCSISDREKQKINSKAGNCIPLVEIKVIVENANYIPFYRIEIPSGTHKPYCTANGTYKVRGDGRTNPLLPNKLLSLFLTTENSLFVERFREATNELENNLLDTKQKVENELRKLLGFIESMNLDIREGLSQISDTAENAESLSDEASSISNETLGMVEELSDKVHYIEDYPLYELKWKVDGILEHFGIEDPLSKKARLIIEKKN